MNGKPHPLVAIAFKNFDVPRVQGRGGRTGIHPGLQNNAQVCKQNPLFGADYFFIRGVSRGRQSQTLGTNSTGRTLVGVLSAIVVTLAAPSAVLALLLHTLAQEVQRFGNLLLLLLKGQIALLLRQQALIGGFHIRFFDENVMGAAGRQEGQ